MEKVESIYELILKKQFENMISDVIRDIKIIEFAILCSNIEYNRNIYTKMVDKYAYDLDRIGYAKALEITAEYYSFAKLSEESLVRNSLSMLRRWIIRCSGYTCIRKIAEDTVVTGLEAYLKKYGINEEVADIYTLNDKIDAIDEDILLCLRNSI